jgi:two-component system, cell cycle sensor histidine kinase and response regulator CckA
VDTGKLITPTDPPPRRGASLRGRMMIYGALSSIAIGAMGVGVVLLLVPQKAVAAFNALGWGVIPLLAVIVGGATFFDSLLLKRFVYGPVRELARIAQKIARTRDLTTRAPAYGSDSVGHLATVFNEMLTHLQQSDRALRASEARYRHLVETMTEGLAILDARGRLRYVNERLGLLLGHTPDSLIGAPLAAQIAGSDRDTYVARLQAAEAQPFEITLRHPDGDHRVVLASATPLVDDGGELEGTLVVLTDLTERRRSEEERRFLGEQLRQAQKMEALGRLAGGVAHDFNNLLTGIDGNLELIRMDLPKDHVAMESLDEGRELVTRAATLTRQLLAMSRKQVLEPRVLDPNRLVKDFQKLLRRVIGEDLELRFELGTPPQIFVDPGQLDQVLMNLAVNARDAMPRGGTLTIRTLKETIDEEGATRHEDLVPATYAVLEVEDDGVGISPDLLERIFEPFFTTKDHGRGTGLGLATVYGIVRQHRGAVEVRTAAGAGAVFRVLIPATDRKVRLRRVTTTTHGIQAHKGTETILFVEDEPALRRAAVSSLSRLGYRVLEAEDGDAGLAVAAQHDGVVDILITDVIMPGRNGRALADALRERQPDLPVLFTSGYAEGVLGDEGLVAEEEHFLPKPYRLSTLARRVREIIATDGTETT